MKLIKKKPYNTECECRQQLTAYAKELNLYNPDEITIGVFIKSHRALRELSNKTNREISEQARKAAEFAASKAKEEVLHGEYIQVEKLRQMTISELVEFLQ